jgi:hypothetical protein
MTPAERTCADALARCTFLPGEYNKRFARNIAALPDDKELSDKQRANLFRLVHRYRRQIPPGVGGETYRVT